jgi:hypothetical protein
MHAVWFDTTGQSWPDTLPEVPHANDGGPGCSTPRDHLLMQRGLVKLKHTAHGIEYALHPDAVHPVALSASFFEVADCAPSRVVVSAFGTCWTHRMFCGAGAAIAHVSTLVSDAQTSRNRHFVRSRVSTDALSQAEPLRQLLTLWHELPAPLHEPVLSTYVRQHMAGRLLVVEACAHGEQMIIRGFGEGLAILDDAWRRNGHGQRLEDVPDHEYGRWSAQSYRMAFRDDAPVLEENDVIVSSPRRPRAHAKYARLILPIETRDGRRMLLGASQPRTIEALPLERG